MLVGIITVAPLPIGLASAMRAPLPRGEQIEAAILRVLLEVIKRACYLPSTWTLGDGCAAGLGVFVGAVDCSPNATETSMQISSGYAAIHGLPEGTKEVPRRAWRTRTHPNDIGCLDAERREAPEAAA